MTQSPELADILWELPPRFVLARSLGYWALTRLFMLPIYLGLGYLVTGSLQNSIVTMGLFSVLYWVRPSMSQLEIKSQSMVRGKNGAGFAVASTLPPIAASLVAIWQSQYWFLAAFVWVHAVLWNLVRYLLTARRVGNAHVILYSYPIILGFVMVLLPLFTVAALPTNLLVAVMALGWTALLLRYGNEDPIIGDITSHYRNRIFDLREQVKTVTAIALDKATERETRIELDPILVTDADGLYACFKYSSAESQFVVFEVGTQQQVEKPKRGVLRALWLVDCCRGSQRHKLSITLLAPFAPIMNSYIEHQVERVSSRNAQRLALKSLYGDILAFWKTSRSLVRTCSESPSSELYVVTLSRLKSIRERIKIRSVSVSSSEGLRRATIDYLKRINRFLESLENSNQVVKIVKLG